MVTVILYNDVHIAHDCSSITHCAKAQKTTTNTQNSTNNTLFYKQFICTSSTTEKIPDRQLGFLCRLLHSTKAEWTLTMSPAPLSPLGCAKGPKNYLCHASPHQLNFSLTFFFSGLQGTRYAAQSQNVRSSLCANK